MSSRRLEAQRNVTPVDLVGRFPDFIRLREDHPVPNEMALRVELPGKNVSIEFACNLSEGIMRIVDGEAFLKQMGLSFATLGALSNYIEQAIRIAELCERCPKHIVCDPKDGVFCVIAPEGKRYFRLNPHGSMTVVKRPGAMPDIGVYYTVNELHSIVEWARAPREIGAVTATTRSAIDEVTAE